MIKQLVSGYGHYVALTNSGLIYAWDSNYKGQIGTGDDTNRWEPVLVSHEFGKAVQIAACGDRCAAEFEDGTVRAWGEPYTDQERKMGYGCWFDCVNIDQAFAPFSMWRTLDMRLVTKPVAETPNLQLNDRTKADVCFYVGDQQI
jgi:alpha-tubulin suppressor-like RCC1 family protein